MRRSCSWILQRCALLPPTCLGLFLATEARLTGHLPGLDTWLYGGCLSLACALLLALIWAPLALLDARQGGRGALLPLGALLLASAPFVLSIAEHLSTSDGLRARGYSPSLLQAGFLLALAGLLALVWAVQRYLVPRPVPLLLCGLSIALLIRLDNRMGRSHGELAALAEACAAVLCASVVSVVLRTRPRALRLLSVGGTALVSCLAVAAACLPARLARGRRLARVLESSVGYLDGRLAQRVGLLSEPPPRAISAAVCREASRIDAWPALELEEQRRRNVVLISIDSLRADHVSKWVAGVPLMPQLSRLAMDSGQHDPAVAAYPATALSMTTAFTGLLPSELLLASPAPDNLFAAVARTSKEVHAILPSGNYFKRPDVAHHVLRGAQVSTARGAARQTDLAIERLRALRSQGQSHLLWLHYFEPHEPYIQHPHFTFGESEQQRYASEIAYVDQQLGRLLEVLRHEGWYDDSLIVVFADHGEAFGEHGHWFHHHLLYPYLTDVPLVVHAPAPLQRTERRTAHLTDLAPTVLHFLGAARAPHYMTGQSLFVRRARSRTVVAEAFPIAGSRLLAAREPIADERSLRERMERIERGPGYSSKLAVVDSEHRLVLHRGSGASELYRHDDTKAARDLADLLPAKRAALEQAAEEWRARLLVRARCALAFPTLARDPTVPPH